MSAIFALGEPTIEEIAGHLADPPSHSALRTHLLILERKNQVSRFRDGRRNRYRALEDRESVAQKSVRHVVRTFFGGSLRGAVMALLQDDELESLDPEAVARITELLEESEGDASGADT